MCFKRNIKLFFYRMKDQKIYYMISVFYIFLMAGLAFFTVYHNTLYFPKDYIYKLLHVFTPFFSLFWILPVIGERTDEKWGEFFVGCKTDTVFQVIIHNIVFDLAMFLVCCVFSGVYGNMLNIYIQMVITNVLIQCIGITALYLSSSVFSAYGIPFLYSCLTIFSLIDPENRIGLSYVAYEEVTLSGYIAAHWWKMILVFLMTFYSIFKSKI